MKTKLKTIGYSLIAATLLTAVVLSSRLANNKLEEKDKPLDSSGVTATTDSLKNKLDVLKQKKTVKKASINESNVVFLFDEVSPESSNQVIKRIKDLNLEGYGPIYLVIDSPGGSVLDGARVISAMESSNRPVHTACYSICASMGAMIHSFGAKRYSFDRSILMYHNAAGGVIGELTKMLSQLKMIERYVGRMEQNVVNRSTLKIEEYRAMADRELWVEGEDAVNLKLSDGLIYLDGLEDMLAAKNAPELKGRKRLQFQFKM